MKAARVLSLGITVLALSVGLAAPVRLTARGARLTHVVTSRPADPYLTGFESADSRAEWSADAAAGVYDVRFRYRARDRKSAVLRVNGVGAEVQLPKTGDDFAAAAVGRVELRAGANAIGVEEGWGFYDLADVEFSPADLRPPGPVPGVTCDPSAIPEARSLLKSLAGSYGRETWSGQYGSADDATVVRLTGRRPCIFGADLMDFSPSRDAHGTKPTGLVDGLIRRSQSGQVVTLCWHWNAPAGLVDKMATGPDGRQKDLRWYRGFYADATTFDVGKTMADPSSPDYALLIRDIDAIAVPLRQLSDAGVPILWRPLHEAEGKWFWWGAKGPGPFKALWRLTYDRLVRHHDLHNLVWVFTDDADPAWYPGDDVVDVVGYDAYPKEPRDVATGHWIDLSARYAGKKPVALTEFGGIPDVAAVYRLGCPWAYWVSWIGAEGPVKSGDAATRAAYADPRVRSAAHPA